MTAEALSTLQNSLADALQPVFAALVAVAGVSLAVALLYARNEPRQSTRDDGSERTAFDRA